MTNNQLIIIGGAAALFILFKVVKMLGQVSAKKAKEIMDEGNAYLIDVRTSGEYGSGHIKKAMNVPLDRISGITKKVGKDKNVIVYCQSGSRSSQAARQLKSMGYTKVYNLGGINKWKY